MLITRVDATVPTLNPEMLQLARSTIKTMQADPDFGPVVTRVPELANELGCACVKEAGIWTKDGQDIRAIVAAGDCLGNWTILDFEGMTRQFLGDEIT